MSRHRSHTTRKVGLPAGTLLYTGDRPSVPANVHTLWYNDDECVEYHTYSPNFTKRKPGTFWTDIRGLSDTDFIARLGADLAIHPLVLEDVLNTHQRAKLEEYDNGFFFVLPNFCLITKPMELKAEQISFFVGKNFVVSFQEDPDDTFQAVRIRAEEGLGRLRKKGSDYLAYILVDNIVDNYYTVLDELETRLIELEENMQKTGSAGESVKLRIFELKSVLNQFRHRLLPVRDAVSRFYRIDDASVQETTRPYVRDVLDHVAQILDGVDNQRDALDNMQTLYHAETANRLNDIMRVLAIISTIFMPLSFIAGVYGMNFEFMPELHSHYGYVTVLGAMFILSIGMLYYFRRKKWL